MAGQARHRGLSSRTESGAGPPGTSHPTIRFRVSQPTGTPRWLGPVPHPLNHVGTGPVIALRKAVLLTNAGPCHAASESSSRAAMPLRCGWLGPALSSRRLTCRAAFFSERGQHAFVFLLASRDHLLRLVRPGTPHPLLCKGKSCRCRAAIPVGLSEEASMTVRRSIIAMSGAAFLLSTPGALNAQQSPPQPPPAKQETTVVGDHAAEWGWIGLLGLLGLAGLFGGRDRFVGTRPPRT
jgi:hypothetical protein